jgi:hypothetical protein
MPTEYEVGLLVGLLVGEGHFGGDGRQPQITLRMHVRHVNLFHWLGRTFPGGRLYGPYDHSGRKYYQWMARGPYLRDELVPLIAPRITPELDAHSYERLQQMVARYSRQLASLPASEPEAGSPLDAASASEASEAVTPAGTPPESALSRAESIFSRMRDSDTT